MCLCGRLRELAAGINWKGQSTITGRQAGRHRDEGGGGGGLAERGKEKNESGLVCLVRSDNELLTGEGEKGMEEEGLVISGQLVS